MKHLKNLLQFNTTITEDTGEVHYLEASDNNINFKLFPTGFLICSGSFHKYWQHTNSGRFTDIDAVYCLKTFCVSYKIPPEEATVQNIEFGVNFTPPIPTKRILDLLIEHRNTEFDRRFEGQYRSAKHTDYEIKAYNKASQYEMSDNILRFEVKVNRMRKIKGLALYTIHDLISKNWHYSVSNLILNEWRLVFMSEPSGTVSVTFAELIQKTRTQRHRIKKKIEASGRPLHNQIAEAISNELEELKRFHRGVSRCRYEPFKTPVLKRFHQYIGSENVSPSINPTKCFVKPFDPEYLYQGLNSNRTDLIHELNPQMLLAS